MARPYGVALLIAGVDLLGPSLFTTDPSGTLIKYKAKAIGSAAEGAQNLIREQYREDLSLNESIEMALSILKQVMEEGINNSNIEVCVVSIQEKKFKSLAEDEVQVHLDRVNNV